ncbi:hypothetical protein GAY31_18850 [Azospirillum brasilense]|nr:hypothetical protein [Azospirillum brasilense]
MIRKLFRTPKITPVHDQPAVIKAQSVLNEAIARHEAAQAAVGALRQRLLDAEEAAGLEVLNGAAPADLHDHHQELAKAQSGERILGNAVKAARNAYKEAIEKAKAEVKAALQAEYAAALKELETKIKAAIEPLRRAQDLRRGQDFGLGGDNPLLSAPEALSFLDEQALARFGASIEAWMEPRPTALPPGVKVIRLLKVPFGPGPEAGHARRLTNLNAGEIGGFPAQTADAWVKAGLAEYVP